MGATVLVTASNNNTRENTDKEMHPIFQRYTLEQLATRLGMKKTYLARLESGQQPIRPRFRKRVARILDLPEAELFEIKSDRKDQV